MSALALLLELAGAGIRLEALDNERLRYLTPPGVAIAPYLARLRLHKPELLALLADADRLRLACADAIFETDAINDGLPYRQTLWTAEVERD